MLAVVLGEYQLQTIIICMPRKHIHITQLNARSPFTHAQMHFMVKLREKQPMAAAEMEMENKVMRASLNEIIQFQYDLEHRDELALYVIAIGGCDRVVNIGYISLDLKQHINEKKQFLKGVANQNGYLIYSIKDEPMPQQSRLSSVLENRENNKVMSQVSPKNAGLQSLTQMKAKQQDGKQYQRSELESKQLFIDNNQPSCQSMSPLRRLGKQIYNSQIDILNTGSKVMTQNIKSEPHFYSSSKNKLSKCSYFDGSENKYKKARQKLAVQKQKNNNYNSELMGLQRQFIRQQQKIKQLGIINKQ